MGREFTVLGGVTQGGFPAPQPLAYCDDDAVIGARFLVMEYVEGRIISSDAAAEGLAAADASALSAELIDVLAQGERHVEELADEICQSIANTSFHLRTLATTGLVTTMSLLLSHSC